MRRADRAATRARALGPHVLAIHRRAGDQHRLVLLNFGAEEARVDLTTLDGAPADARWHAVWTIGDQAIGRCAWDEPGWRLPARSGVVLAS